MPRHPGWVDKLAGVVADRSGATDIEFFWLLRWQGSTARVVSANEWAGCTAFGRVGEFGNVRRAAELSSTV